MLVSSLTALVILTAPVDVAAIPAEAQIKPLRLTYDSFTESAIPEFNLGLLQDAAPVPAYGDDGSTRFTVQGAFGIHESENYYYAAGVGFEHFLADDISFVTQFDGVYVDQTGDDTVGANLVLLFRWHFHTRETWSAYLEAGAGVAWFSDDVPYNGSEFNFTPQAALGVTFDISESNRAYAAVGWHHISNANLSDHNPGRDSLMIHVGLSFPF